MNKRLVPLFLAVLLGLSCFQADFAGLQIPNLPAETVHAQETVDSTVDRRPDTGIEESDQNSG